MKKETHQKATKTYVSNKEKRYEKVRARFNELCGQRIEGMKLDHDDIITKLADEFDYAESTIKSILKG